MPVSGIRLVDANVWLALAFVDHVHHQTAASWFEMVGEGEAVFCRITQMALLQHLRRSLFQLRQQSGLQGFEITDCDFEPLCIGGHFSEP